MSLLSKEALQAAAVAQNLPREMLTIAALGGEVIIQGMSGKQRDDWERSLMVGRGKRRDVNTTNVRAKLAVQCLVDDKGQRILTDADADWLGNLRVDVLNQMFEVAQRLSGVSDGDIDELKKSSETVAGSASPTA